jgi:glycosyltransferase involved in cell wall biosynthesis
VDATLVTPKVHRLLAYLPFPGRRWVDRLNGRLLRASLRRGLRRHGLRDPLVWVGIPSPAVAAAFDGWRPGPLVYDAHDDFAAFHGGAPAIRAAERSLAGGARVVFATSAVLEQRFARFNARTVRLRNAADTDLFARGGELPEPPELSRWPRPWIGYVGEIGPWFDAQLVAQAALSQPAASFVLVGQVHGRAASSLRGLPNVHLVGRRAYASVPAYVARFDVCLLPFRIEPLTAAVDPIKVYEYLAAGRPVVSTPLAEVEAFAEHVAIASGEAFVGALRAALASAGDSDAASRRLAAVRAHTWDARVEAALGALRRFDALPR